MSKNEVLEDYRNVVNDLKSFHPTTGSFEARDEEAVIKGDALGEGTWNMFYYPSDELEEATDTLIGVPLVIGHGKDEMDEVGEVTDATWNDSREVIEFKADVSSDKVSQMIKRGVVDSVSVGVEFDEENEGDERVARNLDFYELALVKEPAFVDGIKEIIDEEVPEEEQDKLNEMSQGGEKDMGKVVLDIPKKVYEDLHDKEELEVENAYPSGKYPEYGYRYPGYRYPSYGYPSYRYPSYRYPYRYPEKEEAEEENDYPSYSNYPGPSPLTSTFKEIFRRVDKLADEVGIEFETKYEYPKPKYPSAQEQGDIELSELEEDAILQVEVDEDKAQGLLEDINGGVRDLVDEAGYPGSDSEMADILDDLNDKIDALAGELGMEID